MKFTNFPYNILIFLKIQITLSDFERRILNGNDAALNEAPYMAQVRHIDEGGFRDEGVCGGSLITKSHVISAAHCVMDIDLGDESAVVILGAVNFYDTKEETRQRFITKDFWIHENFSRSTIENDIAILKLPTEAQINEHVKIIEISTEKKLTKGMKAIFYGWGLNNEGNTATKLQTAIMKIIPFKSCLKFKNDYWEALTENNLCAIGVVKKKTAKICNGDSGGPLVAKDSKKLIGIASYVNDAKNGIKLPHNVCDSPTVPDVYVLVSKYLNWISEKSGLKF